MCFYFAINVNVYLNRTISGNTYNTRGYVNQMSNSA